MSGDRDRWWTVVNKVMNLRVPYKDANLTNERAVAEPVPQSGIRKLKIYSAVFVRVQF